MTVEEAIELSIVKATASEVDSAYYQRVFQTPEYGSNGEFARTIDAAKQQADEAVAFHQSIKVALVAIL